MSRTEDAEGAEMFFGWCGSMNVVQCEMYGGSRGGAEGAEMFFGWCESMNVVQCEMYGGSRGGAEEFSTGDFPWRKATCL